MNNKQEKINKNNKIYDVIYDLSQPIKNDFTGYVTYNLITNEILDFKQVIKDE